MEKRGKLIIFSAPSGSGKSTIIQSLLQRDLNLSFSISATSRAPRGTEKNGVEYYFISPEEFRQRIANGEFLEYEEVYAGKYYGTLKSEVERILDSGRNVIFDVDVVGGLNIKKYYGDQALALFIQPPSIEELKRRLNHRATDAPEVIASRIAKAEYELSFAPKFDCIIVNDILEKAQEEAYQTIRQFLDSRPDTAVVLATSRHASLFLDVNADIYYCLDGSEASRLTANVGKDRFRGTCVLPPYPRVMGTDVPEYARESTYELEKVDVVDAFRTSITAIALQLASELSEGEVFLAGYDGYPGNVLSEKEATLTNENNSIFRDYAGKTGRKPVSLTPTIYKSLEVNSIYQLI